MIQPCLLSYRPRRPDAIPFHAQRKHEWEAHRRSTRVLVAALGYALRGWPVLPCKPAGKEPLTAHGHKDGTTDPTSIRSFWNNWPTANVAIATGHASKLLVVDVDPRNGGNEQLAALEKRHGALPAGRVVETSGGGQHFYFRLPKGVSIPSRQLVPGIDIKCDGGYVMAPPSLHPSGHVYRLECGGDMPPVLDWLLATLQQKTGANGVQDQDSSATGVEDLRIGDAIKQLIREGKPQGQRSEAIFSVLRAMVMNGHSDDIISVMMNPDYGISQKPRQQGAAWLQGEIKRAQEKPDRDAHSGAQGYSSTARSSGGHAADSASGNSLSYSASSSVQARSAVRFKLLSADELKKLPPPQWLLLDLIVAESFAVLYGPPGIGKSFLALDFALSIATGCEGVAQAKFMGSVVYIAAEGQGGLRKRIEAWEIANDRKAENIYFLPEPVNFIDETEAKTLILAIRALPAPPLLIVIDTMARCLSGADENSSKDVGAFVRIVDAMRRTFNCAVLTVHHGTKSNAQTERGSSALRGAADTMLFLQGGARGLTLSCEKQKDAAPFESHALYLEPIDLEDGETSCVVRFACGGGTAAPGGHLNDHEMAIVKMLTQDEERTYSELKNRFIADTKLSKRTFDRALSDLTTRGLIEKTDDGKYVPS